jgi:hypothetical protein
MKVFCGPMATMSERLSSRPAAKALAVAGLIAAAKLITPPA